MVGDPLRVAAIIVVVAIWSSAKAGVVDPTRPASGGGTQEQWDKLAIDVDRALREVGGETVDSSRAVSREDIRALRESHGSVTDVRRALEIRRSESRLRIRAEQDRRRPLPVTDSSATLPQPPGHATSPTAAGAFTVPIAESLPAESLVVEQRPTVVAILVAAVGVLAGLWLFFRRRER